MSWRALGILALLVTVLGYLYLEREEERQQGSGVVSVLVPLLEGFAPERVQSVRIDSIERAVQVRLENDGRGLWFMTDPVAYPAEGGVLVLLLRTLEAAMGAPAGGVSAEEAQLDPPRAVLEIVQREPDGTVREYRLDVGGEDLDHDRVFVRVHGHSQAPDAAPLVLRTVATIASTLERGPDDYRMRRATPILGSEVIALNRKGRIHLDDVGVVDLYLEAEAEGQGWKRRNHPIVTLEPNAIGLLAVGAAQLEVMRFAFDSPPDWSHWGLDEPQFEIELLARDDRVKLLFGTPPINGPRAGFPDKWFCRREGFDHVWEIDPERVLLLVRPPDDFYDQLLLRGHRDEVQRVRLEGPNGVLLLERTGDRDRPRWSVSRGEGSPVFRADFESVQDVLGKIENARLEYPDELIDEDVEPTYTLAVTTSDGARWGGVIGAKHEDRATGVVGRRFLRFGDELPAVVPRTVCELFDLSVDTFRSPEIHRVRAEDVSRVVLRRGGEVLDYSHPDEKSWVFTETGMPSDGAFERLTQTLFSMGAEEWLEDFDAASLENPIEAELYPASGGVPLRLTLGAAPDGRLVCIRDGNAAVVDRRRLERHAETWGAEFLPALEELF